ncbi:hypothetical protein [Coxiella-like endosymbiont]|uniref:hypothetical protein n=1 Tax=Coxiella-like endosymbiont TaxID=1592897 RepID=UPI00272C530D|nr:hypothetical protein [Coxiella-like endosymbiont]
MPIAVQADLLVYSLRKGGLMTMARNLENALGKEGIRVNQLNVDWTLTENESKIKEVKASPTPLGIKILGFCAIRTRQDLCSVLQILRGDMRYSGLSMYQPQQMG